MKVTNVTETAWISHTLQISNETWCVNRNSLLLKLKPTPHKFKWGVICQAVAHKSDTSRLIAPPSGPPARRFHSCCSISANWSCCSLILAAGRRGCPGRKKWSCINGGTAGLPSVIALVSFVFVLPPKSSSRLELPLCYYATICFVQIWL